MSKYGDIQEDFYQERTRILDALDQPENSHIIMRLIGALAFRSHCPQFCTIQDALGREFTDIDFVAYRRFFQDIVRLLTELGYEEDKTVTRLFGEYRLLFHDPAYGRHIDVFFERLHFCHTIPLARRLEVDAPTIPLAELLLEKMQIVQINEKDLIDTIMLLREHPIGDTDDEAINAEIISGLTSKDWGWWRTLTGNLATVDEFLDRYPQLTDKDRRVVRERLRQLEERIEARPKAIRWKLRSLIGERIKWYEEVEELAGRGV
jgi:hypothetical protein